MNWNSAIRQTHRWLSIAFITGVLIYILAMRHGRPPGWVGLFPLLPLISLLLSGLYMFVLPYTARMRRAQPATVD